MCIRILMYEVLRTWSAPTGYEMKEYESNFLELITRQIYYSIY